MAGERERPGNTPVEQQERSPNETDEARPGRLAISGPGAADFLAAQGGADLPGTGGTEGMGQTRDGGPLGEGAKRLVPRLAPESIDAPGVRDPSERLTGSQTGTVGGGGADAHNASPVRATGVDDPTVPEARSARGEDEGERE